MTRFANWCSERRWYVIGAWIVAIVALGIAALTAGARFNTDTSLPPSESTTAYELLAQVGALDGTQTGRIVWQPATDAVAIDDAAIQAQAGTMLDAVAEVPGVVAVLSPYVEGGASQISLSTDTAFANIVVMPDADVAVIREVATETAGADLNVTMGGTAFNELPAPSPGIESIGILFALGILFIAFRSKWAAVLPVLTGVVGVGVSLLTVVLATHLMDLPFESITMGSMIGLGVGIDYALFITYRFRKALINGADVHTAVARAMNTSGRAVIFAGLTVIIALAFMFTVNMALLTGMSIAAAITVFFTILTAVTLLPAILTSVGTKVLSNKQRVALAEGDYSASSATSAANQLHTSAKPTRSARWANLVVRRPIPMMLAGLALIAAVALPAAGMRVGNADVSADPIGSHGREYFDMITPGFGEGIDATLVLVATLPDAAATAAFNNLTDELWNVDGVAAVQAVPVPEGQPIAIGAVVPTHSAQTGETADLISNLRTNIIPAAAGDTGMEVFIGGEAASNIDLGAALMGSLPMYLGIIAVLGFVLLAIAFRSVLVPLMGALSNLLTICVGFGIVTLVFQRGYGSELLGAGSAAPVMWIIPVILTGVMFGLSMDYQVFLVSRMHEEYGRTHDNRRAIRVGLQETAPVIMTAALIMFSIFITFGFAGQRIVAGMGIGLATAVLLDAFVMRLTVIPALMRLIGCRNWAYPRWADRITPHLSIEGSDDAEDAVATLPLDDDEAINVGLLTGQQKAVIVGKAA